MSSLENSLLDMQYKYEEFDQENPSFAELSKPPKILATVIFNHTPNIPLQDRYASGEAGTRKRPVKPMPLFKKTSVAKRKRKTVLKATKKRPVSAQPVKNQKRFNLENVLDLNVEIKKIVKLFEKHAKVCHGMKSDLLKQGGSKLIKYV